jgi:hypothetical protein
VDGDDEPPWRVGAEGDGVKLVVDGRGRVYRTGAASTRTHAPATHARRGGRTHIGMGHGIPSGGKTAGSQRSAQAASLARQAAAVIGA